MDELIAGYLEGWRDRVRDLYQWEFATAIPRAKFRIEVSGESWFEKTVQLKAQLRQRIGENTSDLAVLEGLADYFINEWGGIKNFRGVGTVVENFRRIMGTDAMPQGFKATFAGISSWSKWASLACPNWACIYDARVVYSINAINYMGGGFHRIYPSPDGRNPRLQMLDVPTLLLIGKVQAGDSSVPKDLRANHYIAKAAAYREYLALVRRVSHRLWGDFDHIHEVEMLLFALADENVYQGVFDKVAA
jgi:hypothetical protein